MYVYIQSEPTLFTVGFYNPQGEWNPESDHADREEAAKRVAWLNGSGIQDLEIRLNTNECYRPDVKEHSLLNYGSRMKRSVNRQHLAFTTINCTKTTMKILKNSFDVECDTWDDPGDYPNGVAAGPLPSYDYVCEVTGELLLEIEPGDLDPEVDAEEQYQEMAQEHADIPSGITVTEWAWSYPEPNKVCLSVQDFDASGYEREDTRDYDYDYDYDY